MRREDQENQRNRDVLNLPGLGKNVALYSKGAPSNLRNRLSLSNHPTNHVDSAKTRHIRSKDVV